MAPLGSFTTGDWNITYTSAVTDIWAFNGTAKYDDDGYIKVDKGSPDKSKWAIFYAVNQKDPLIFVNTKKQLKEEIDKLLKRDDVDPKSIRIFGLVGGSKAVE